eukprot:1148682-Pelagomonas_calceolata.AAC.8
MCRNGCFSPVCLGINFQGLCALLHVGRDACPATGGAPSLEPQKSLRKEQGAPSCRLMQTGMMSHRHCRLSSYKRALQNTPEMLRALRNARQFTIRRQSANADEDKSARASVGLDKSQ